MFEVVNPVVFLIVGLSFLSMLDAVFDSIVGLAASILAGFFHTYKPNLFFLPVKKNSQKNKKHLTFGLWVLS